MTGGLLPGPIDRQTETAELCLHLFDVAIGPDPWIDLTLDRCILSRKSERIPAHRVKHGISTHALSTRDHIGDDVIAHVAHVQASRWVGKHREGVKGFLTGLR